MKYTKSDLLRAENLIKIIKRGKYELDGMEALAFSQACAWFNGIVEEIKAEVEKKPDSFVIKPIGNPISMVAKKPRKAKEE